MKSLFYILLRTTLYGWGKLAASSIGEKWRLLRDLIYAELLSHRFRSAPRLHTMGSPLYIYGGKRMDIGRDTTLCFGTRLEAITQYLTGQKFHPSIRIGQGVYVGPHCHIGAIQHIEIGDHCTLGERTYITDHTHGHTTSEEANLPPLLRPLVSRGPVVIGKHVSLGENCVVMPNVTIGDYSVVGANAVVTHDIPPYCVAVGSPARIIKTFSPIPT